MGNEEARHRRSTALIRKLDSAVIKAWMRSTGLVTVLICSSNAGAQHPSLDLDELLARPYVQSLDTSPSGAVAWAQFAEGVWNAWVASPPGYVGKQVTQYTELDGQEISGLRWSGDSHSIVYVRGGGANRRGEFPNPANNPDGTSQGIWRVTSEDWSAPIPAPSLVAAGSDFALQPGGKTIAIVSRGQILTGPLDGSRPVVQLIQARGSASTLRWSPDGRRLAFVSNRDRHSLIGVVEVESRTLRYIDASLDYDSNPAWSPDGNKLAFTRVPFSSGIGIFVPVASGTPWSIVIADVAKGGSRTAWAARTGKGSIFRYPLGSPPLLWCSQDRIVFPWEGDGWTHFYSMSVESGSTSLLTPGPFEVESAVCAQSPNTLAFVSNQGDIDRRHIWTVDIRGGKGPTPITAGKSIEWDARAAGSEIFAFLQSNATETAHPAIRRADGTVSSLIPMGSLRSGALVEPVPVTYKAADGTQIRAQLFTPPASVKKRAAIVYVHGGPKRQMLLGWHPVRYYHNVYAINQYLASQGYIVLSINFRSGTGYGLEFREPPGAGAAGASEYADVLGAHTYLKSRADVDADRIGIWGASYGGYLTGLALARNSSLFKAGADIEGIYDWNSELEFFFSDYRAREHQEEFKVARAASPIASISTWRSPVLVVHGDDDRNVEFAQSSTLIEALRFRGVSFEQVIFADEVHDFLLQSSMARVGHAVADFFQRWLPADR